jgi:hypothetical protein
MCAAQLPPAERESFAAFARVLAMLQHQQSYVHIEELKDAWQVLKAWSDPGTTDRPSVEERDAARRRVEAQLTDLAHEAGFVVVDASELDRAFRDHALLKVRMVVDPNAIDKRILFRRDTSTRTEQVRTWFGLRQRPVTFTDYGMVLVYAAFKDVDEIEGTERRRLTFQPGSTTVKLFQDVPSEDLEMVLPNIKVRMRLVDKMYIGVPALISGGVVIATKLLATLVLLVLLLAYWTGLRHQPVTLNQTAVVSAGVGLAALGSYFVRQVTKFNNRRTVFLKALSENLYFRSLDHDIGVFHHLLGTAEETQTATTLLAYHVLGLADDPLTTPALALHIEQWLAEHRDADIDADLGDVVGDLRRLSLVTEHDDGRVSAIGLTEARHTLEQMWVDLVRTSTAVPTGPVEVAS